VPAFGIPQSLVGGRNPINTLRKTISPWIRLEADLEVPNPRLILFFIMCLAFAMRILNVLTTSAIDLDGTIYADLGDAFSRGAFREGLNGVFPPLYPMLIGLVHLIVPDLETAAVIVSFGAGLLTVYLSYFFFRNLIGESRALYGALFVAINPYLVKFSSSVLTESVATLLVLIAVFSFYKGWTENNETQIVLSGFSLSLTYLTRPEYLIYSVPLSALLLVRKRYLHVILFLLSFALLTAAYIYWMRYETGLLVFSKKAILAKRQGATGSSPHAYLLPIAGFANIGRRTYLVLSDLLNGLLPQFVLLAAFGISRTEKRYRALTALLLVFHIMPMVAMSALSKRLYIELFPLLLPFFVAGLFSLKSIMEKFRPGKKVYYALIAFIVGLSLFQGINLPDRGRGFNKKAGLYLLAHDPHTVVASRLPLVPFYSRGEWSYLPWLARGVDTCPALFAQAQQKGVPYAAVDEKVEKENPFIAECLKSVQPIAKFGDNEEFLKLYRLYQRP
jgi:4-amino-4-deoxy-L-arabinose transferase-like glycosyltransferase